MLRPELTADDRSDIRTDTAAGAVGAAVLVAIGETRLSWMTRKNWKLATRRTAAAVLGAAVGPALYRFGGMIGLWQWPYKKPWIVVK